FSSSSILSRLASDTSMPPYLDFQLYSVASDIPYFRQRSAAFAPASFSRNTAMICSSVNLLRFIGPSFSQGRTLTPGGGISQWQVTTATLPSASIGQPWSAPRRFLNLLLATRLRPSAYSKDLIYRIAASADHVDIDSNRSLYD